MKKLADKLMNELKVFEPSMVTAPTGSIYIQFANSKIKQVRIANHPGRKTSRNCWELRSDSCSIRKPSGRIYNARDIANLIKDFK
tara:strand:- start:146 stop:400 length:255 start_codon:yes stop_codon:yes gene_type:complete